MEENFDFVESSLCSYVGKWHFGMLARTMQRLGQLSRLGDMNQGLGYMFLPPKEHLVEKVLFGLPDNARSDFVCLKK